MFGAKKNWNLGNPPVSRVETKQESGVSEAPKQALGWNQLYPTIRTE